VRLKQIKLAGFKSFVDPTAFEVPGQLVGVVGPNGCGKSNIMDAVRWVLGESKASELRGESMQDVIFSGSSERKAASRASVELVFDNTLGRIGGTWGTFAELSVKRVLTRDGQSTYWINNQSVRRKDVHDIFLGTGLGPRAYAIIGQGMISRIIEARPEDLRVFLEEAAGVSKYKERRRETENRLADTRENLTRVDDILRELNGQIEKLERQAEVAQQYRDYEAERDRKQRMLWLMRRDEAHAEQVRIAEQVTAAVTALEARLAEQRSVEAEIETLRSAHYAAGDEVHAAQGRYYDANAEVARLESEIRYVVESQGQLGERIGSLADQERRAREDRDQARADAQAAREGLEAAQTRAEALAQRVLELSDALPEFDAAVREARATLDEARAAALRTRQAIELSATRQRAAEQSLANAERREERLRVEAQQLQAPPQEELDAMRASVAAAEEAEHATGAAQEQAEDAWRAADAERAPAQQGLRESEAKLAQIEARIAALRQLQERAQSQARIVPWLSRHGLATLTRLWQRLRIEDGWETALESVLRERVESLEVGQLEHVAGLAADAPPAKVAFFSARPAAPAAAPAPGLRPLLEVVRATEAGLQSLLAEWFHGWYVLEDLEQGVARRGDLPAGAQFVTRAGHVVGRLSVQMYAPDSEQEGILVRQHELENLARELRAQHLLADEARGRAARAESTAAELATRVSAARDEHNAALRRLAGLRLEAQRLEQQLERASHTRERIDQELAEVAQGIETARRTIEEETSAFERLDAELAQRQQHAEELAQAHEATELRLAQRRDDLRQAERDAQEASFATRELQGRLERLAAAIEQAERLEAQSRSEREQCEARLGELSDAGARAALEAALQARVGAEQLLSAARQRLDELTQTLKGRDERRLAAERDQEPLRQRVTELQLREQAARLNAEQFASQLAEAQVDEEALRASFAESGANAAPKASWLQGEVTRLVNAIAALGPVNLAALDELTGSRERKGFLDSQSADLDQAITTLEDAIRKIDRETREVLQQTYDTVNLEFGKLFPELFGGGEARLILTGDEILDAGVTVMAQPPGKRNTSIHLLSGGEKALTAIALVFAMFQLNPAPFCLLDEVDAPLDDANTERYCDMVRRMSDHTQFVFITHNKIAMELATQLVGVTMQERGVSRVVAVDLESAARMAEAA
jgi:chromosome segregation protein